MGLWTAFVLPLDRRGLLAILAFGVSVGYTLTAGAAVSGLEEAQSSVSEGLRDTHHVVARPDGAPLALSEFVAAPDVSLAVQRTANRTFFTVRLGPEAGIAVGEARAGAASGLRPGDRLHEGPHAWTVRDGDAPRGAAPGWVQLHPADFAALRGVAGDDVHIVSYNELTASEAERLEYAGYVVSQAPAALSFYREGAAQLVTTVGATAIASGIVVALLASSVVDAEVRAHRRSFATLRFYAGPALVTRLTAARCLFLLSLGHVVGLLFLGVVAVGLRRPGQGLVIPPAEALLPSLLLTGLGGLLGLGLGLAVVHRRLDAKELAGPPPSARFGRLGRPLLASWRAAVPLALSAMVLAGSLGVAYGVADFPEELFGAFAGDQVVTSPTGNPLRGVVPAFLGENLALLEGVEAASPEVFAPTFLRGRPTMVRGVDWPSFIGFEDVEMRDGVPPLHRGEASLGRRVANAHGLGPGSPIVLPVSYASGVVHVNVVGVHDSAGLLADEVLVDLATAQELAGLAPASVNLIRVRTALSATGDRAPFPEIPRGVEVTRVSVVPERPVAFEPVVIKVDFVNFSPTEASRTVTVRVNGQPFEDVVVQMPGETLRTVEVPLRAPQAGTFRIDVNPSYETQATAPAYSLATARTVGQGQPVQVTVTDSAGNGQSGVVVQLDGVSSTTDASGRATLVASQVGNRSLIAEGPAGRAAQPLLVVAPEDLDQAHLVHRRVDGPTFMSPGNWSGVVWVENVGGREFQGPMPLWVNGTELLLVDITVRAGESSRVPVSLGFAEGEHRIGPANVELLLKVVGEAATSTPSPTAPTTSPVMEREIDRLLRMKRAQAAGEVAPRRDVTEGFLGETVQNLQLALTVLTLASVLHAGLVTVAVVRRDLERSSATLGTLSAMGAPKGYLSRRAALEFGLIGTGAAALGTAMGLLAAMGAAELGILRGFGHALSPRSDVEFLLRLALAAVGTTVLAALVQLEQFRSRSFRILVAEGPARAERPPLSQMLGGDD